MPPWAAIQTRALNSCAKPAARTRNSSGAWLNFWREMRRGNSILDGFRWESGGGPASGAGIENQRLGPYQILSKLGAGGMGSVFLVQDTRLGRKVAIKVSHGRYSQRFEREARAIAALNSLSRRLLLCQLGRGRQTAPHSIL